MSVGFLLEQYLNQVCGVLWGRLEDIVLSEKAQSFLPKRYDGNHVMVKHVVSKTDRSRRQRLNGKYANNFEQILNEFLPKTPLLPGVSCGFFLN